MAGGIVLGLRAGDIVEVRRAEEILATLDDRARFDRVPFMPEMLQYCGRRFRVSKRAHKTCDPAHTPWSLRRLENVVHLEDLRCDGSGHGGCQAGCLLFWHEAWLRRVGDDLVPAASLFQHPAENRDQHNRSRLDTVYRACQRQAVDGEPVFACQATELRTYSSHLPLWDIRQYFRDLNSGNLAPNPCGSTRSERALEGVLATLQLLRCALIAVFNRAQKARRGPLYPRIEGPLQKTSAELLDLQPGELVQIRSKEEIIKTLDRKNRNRGLLFDSEMLRYCGGIFRVSRRVQRLLDEQTGKMLTMKQPCIVLEGVSCQSEYHWFCPRAIHHYWRESWLQRVANVPHERRAHDKMSAECENLCPVGTGSAE
jgi:hypothetical protein